MQIYKGDMLYEKETFALFKTQIQKKLDNIEWISASKWSCKKANLNEKTF